MSDDTITIEVDGKPVTAHKGQMLIEVTDQNDIYVPRFCYHKKLSVAANCRMCLVEVEKAPKPLPACATPCMDGMKVHTRSQKAIESQKSVMEFLLINHPLDCPICDQGGECELQDLAMGYGRDVSRYLEKKRVVKDKNIGPLVQTDMTRCIHCTRCVRFGQEIAGLRELGATGRGEHMQIGTYIEKSMASEMSGNIIDICPVGALTSKPFRFSARAWEMQQSDSIAPHDSIGSNIQIHHKQNRVKRVVPGDNESVNEIWISDRDRFSYEGLYHPERLDSPMIKNGDTWENVDWETALDFVRDGVRNIIDQSGAGQIGALVSPSATIEEQYQLQKLVRGIGSNNIDHRIRQCDFRQQESEGAFPGLGCSLVDLEQLNTVLLVGSNVRKEQPLVNHRLRKASMRGADIFTINSVDYDFNFNVSGKLKTSPSGYLKHLNGILQALQTGQSTTPNEYQAIVSMLKDKQPAHIILGNTVVSHPQYSEIRAAAMAIAEAAGCGFGIAGEFANEAGAWLSGAVPHRQAGNNSATASGLDAVEMLARQLKAYFIFGIEPELDCWNGNMARNALENAEFVVSFSAFNTMAIQSYANVILPLALFAETAGTYVNHEGRWQSFTGAVLPPGDARPGWKILRVLGNLFELNGFDYNSPDEVRDEVKTLCSSETAKIMWSVSEETNTASDGLLRIADVPMNNIDPLVRRAKALQQTSEIADGQVHVNATLAQRLGLESGALVTVTQLENRITLPLIIDDRVADGCVLISAAQPCHSELGGMMDTIELGRA